MVIRRQMLKLSSMAVASATLLGTSQQVVLLITPSK
jgi:hypothetical protein